MQNKYNCPICLDKGFVPYNKKEGNNIYQHVAYCTCKSGSKYRYDGRSCEKRPTKYYIPNVEQHFDTKQLAKENINNLLVTFGKERIKEILRI